MGGIFGVASRSDCVSDLFFGTDYHCHLGTKRGGMAVWNENGFVRSIHNIENAPFRTKFERDVEEMSGNSGIGCISDTEPQPLIIRSHLGSFAITTVGRINNIDALMEKVFSNGNSHFLEMSHGKVNPTELVAVLINQCQSIVEGIQYAQEMIDGSMTMLVLTERGIYAARDRMGRTPLILGQKEDAVCVSSESFAYLNLGYSDLRELGPGEVALVTHSGVETVVKPRQKMKICAFLWTYYGYPSSCYEGVNVEAMRYENGKRLAKQENVDVDYVAGIPDSGTAHAIGYATQSGIPFARPFIKYTPTWPRSFMPQNQSMRNLVAKMKLIPIDKLIRGKRLLFIDDSIVRGTQMGGTAQFLYSSGAQELHIRSACPPIMFGCKYLNFSRSTTEYDLISRRAILELEGKEGEKHLEEYVDPSTERYRNMVECIGHKLNFTTLEYQKLEDLLAAIGIDPESVCTYCWDGRE